MKKLLLILGTLTTIAAPVTAIVSCGSTGSLRSTEKSDTLEAVKKSAIVEVNKLKLSDDQKEGAILVINNAEKISAIIAELSTARGQADDTSNHVTSEAKTYAKTQIEGLGGLSDEDKTNAKAEVDNQATIEDLLKVISKYEEKSNGVNLSNEDAKLKVASAAAFAQFVKFTKEQLLKLKGLSASDIALYTIKIQTAADKQDKNEISKLFLEATALSDNNLKNSNGRTYMEHLLETLKISDTKKQQYKNQLELAQDTKDMLSIYVKAAEEEVSDTDLSDFKAKLIVQVNGMNLSNAQKAEIKVKVNGAKTMDKLVDIFEQATVMSDTITASNDQVEYVVTQLKALKWLDATKEAKAIEEARAQTNPNKLFEVLETYTAQSASEKFSAADLAAKQKNTIAKLSGLNLTPSELTKITGDINGATTKLEVDQAFLDATTTSNDRNTIDNGRTYLIGELSTLHGLTQQQKDDATKAIQSANGVEEMITAFNNASGQATVDATLGDIKTAIIGQLDSLHLSSAAQATATSAIQAANSKDEITKAFLDAASLAAQESKLKTEKSLLTNFLAQLNLTDKERTDATEAIVNASTSNEVLVVFQGANVQSDANTEAERVKTQASYDASSGILSVKVNLDQDGKLNMGDLKHDIRMAIHDYEATNTAYDTHTTKIKQLTVIFTLNKKEFTHDYPLDPKQTDISAALNAALFGCINAYATSGDAPFASYNQMITDRDAKLASFKTPILSINDANALLDIFSDLGIHVVRDEKDNTKYKMKTDLDEAGKESFDTPKAIIQHMFDANDFGNYGNSYNEVKRILALS